MKTNLKKLTAFAAAAALLAQSAVLTAMATEETADSINYIVNDTFDKLEVNEESKYFDDCGWTIGATSDDTVYKVNTAFGTKPAQADMAYFTFTPGTVTNGQQANIRKDLETPIDVTKGKVVLETKMAVDSGIYGYGVIFELNRPAAVADLAESAYDNNTYKLFNFGHWTENSLTKSSVYVRNKSGTTNYLDGYTQPEGSSFSRPVLEYGQAVTIKAVIDYANNHVDYYVTYPDGNTYTRTDGTLASHDLATSKEINSISVASFGKGNSSGQVNFWIDYVKAYQILDTSASISTDRRVDSDIKVTFDNAESFTTIDFSKYVSLKTSEEADVAALISYADGVVTINPDDSLAGSTEYKVVVDKDALSALACTYTGTDFTFTTLAENEYLNDTLTKTDASGWTGNSYANFPSDHWAGGDSACVQYTQADGQTTISPYSVQKNLENPINLTEGKVMIEVDMMSDTTSNLEINFNINKDDSTTDNDAIFRVSGKGAGSTVLVRGNNGTLSNAYNPNMTVGEVSDGGRPTFAFAEKINVKAILDYAENTIKYYITFTIGDVVRTYTRDGWGDKNNMTLSGGLPTEIDNLAFTASGVASKFWIDSVKITKADEVSASVSACDVEGVTLAFEGTATDYSEYVDIYDANGAVVASEKEYSEATNELQLKAALNHGETYYVNTSNVALIKDTGIFYSGNTSIGFVPTTSGYMLTGIDSNRGNGAYIRGAIKNNNEEQKTVLAIIAEKNASGVIEKVFIDTIELDAGESEEFEANFLSINASNVIEAFIWEGESLRPLIQKVTVEHK